MSTIDGRAACRRCGGVMRCLPGCQTSPSGPSAEEHRRLVQSQSSATAGPEVIRQAAIAAGIPADRVDELFADGLILFRAGAVRVRVKVLPL